MKNPLTNAFSEGIFEYRSVEKKKLLLAFSITFLVMIIEFAGGLLSHSIALISDAGHMFTHSFAIGLSLIAIQIARKPPCHHKTFGLYRTEIITAFVNGLFLLLVVLAILYKSILRIINPGHIHSLHMLLIATIGLAVNIASIFILHGIHKSDLNTRSVFYHIIADTTSSLAIIIGGLIIFFTGWILIDPIVSLGISIIILLWAWGIIKESTRILLEMAPSGLDTQTINVNLKDRFSEIKAIYNAHVWTITTDMLVYSAHIRFGENISPKQEKDLVLKINHYLSEKYNIIESTIQIAYRAESDVCMKIQSSL